MQRLAIMLVLGILGGNASAADRPSDVRNYIFGNSLIHHLTTSDETTMPHWLHHLAVAGGKRYAVSGQWGFLRNFEEDLPPIDQWSFKDVPDAWNAEKTPFNKAGFNTILVNTANFIQYQAPDRPYHGENRNRQTPLGATLALIDWLEQQQAGLTYFIYEGWEIMDPFTSGFPPDDAEMKAYHAHNIGDYHDWYEHYLKLVKEARPKIDVRLIPVASILSKLLTQTVLSKLKPADLYSDTGPHGTATTYFLAAVITYSMLYDEKAPEDFIVPDTLHSLVRENYAQIIDVVCKEVVSEGKCG